MSANEERFNDIVTRLCDAMTVALNRRTGYRFEPVSDAAVYRMIDELEDFAVQNPEFKARVISTPIGKLRVKNS